MADVTIEAALRAEAETIILRIGPYWVSTTVGYVFYVDADRDLVYNKTSDGGGTWAGPVAIKQGDIPKFDCYPDWLVSGDSGTKIHIAYLDIDTDDLRYIYLDTNGDSVGGDVQVEACQGSGALTASVTRNIHLVSICKTRAGGFCIAARYDDTLVEHFRVFYTSPDATSWTSESTPWEAAVDDFMMLFPGNLADTNDMFALFWDASADEISIKQYDDSGDSWAESSVSANMADHAILYQWGGQIRLSDGHLIVAAWSEYDAATADLKVWDITDKDTITAKTNVITDTSEYLLASVFIDPVSDDIYVAYVGGTTAAASVRAHYKKSSDGGGSWGGETTLTESAEDDLRWVDAGAVKKTWGGKFQPVWQNDDLDDLLTSTVNGVSIAAEESVIEPGALPSLLLEGII